MLVLIAVILALIPAVAILYPFLRRQGRDELLEDESSPQAELNRRWEVALAGLKNTELEASIGNLAEEDYRQIRQQYLTEGALVMKAMELEEEQEREMVAYVEREVQQARLRARGHDAGGPSMTCPHCFSEAAQDSSKCPSCGRSLAIVEPEGPSDQGSAAGGNGA